MEEAMDEQPITAERAKAIAARAAERGYPFLFSVVMAAYNAQDYLEEAVESVVAQSIGFEHTQLIIVDDGSTDETAAICASLQERHPGNIVIVSQENAGVSAARNAGLARAEGMFVNFLDSDDKWSEDAFACALSFFEEHPEVDLVATRIMFFDAKEGGHRLNYKFAKTRVVVDLLEDYDCPQLHVNSIFVRATALEGSSFCETLQVSEDVRFVNELLIRNPKYGALSGPTYCYRQRQDKDSAIDTMKERATWYLDTPIDCSKYLLDLCEREHGRILPFVQFTVMYDMQWRIRAAKPECIDEGQLAEYRQLLIDLLSRIDDSIISEQRTISIDQVAYTFTLKYGSDVFDVLDNLEIDDGWLATNITCRDGKRRHIRLRPLDSLSDKLTIEHMRLDGDVLVIDGIITSFRFRPEDVSLSITANNKPVMCEVFETHNRPLRNPFDDDAPGKTGFVCAIPIQPEEEVRLKASMRLFDNAQRELKYRFDPESGLSRDPEFGEYLLASNCEFRIGTPGALSIRRFANDVDTSDVEWALTEAHECMLGQIKNGPKVEPNGWTVGP